MKLLFSLITIFVFSSVYCKPDSLQMVKYTPDFEFNDGIFFSFEQVVKNNPIPKSRVISQTDFSDANFYNNLLVEKKVLYYNNLGQPYEVETKNIWGYAKNGVLYINVNQTGSRITLVGNISHFVANVISYSNNTINPYYGGAYDPYGFQTPVQATTEMQQFILDFKTGKIYDYDVKGMEVVLMHDPELYDEYQNLSKKKKKQLKFIYIRKYNERNPLMFPK